MTSVAKRKITRPVCLGNVQIGGGAPVAVQSMTCTDTRDVKATVAQIRRLEKAGCEIARVAVPDMDAAMALGAIKKKINLPLIADIHFDYRLALEAIRRGADGIRINPGNMKPGKIREVIKAAKASGTVIRIGINSGSLEKELHAKYGGATADALVASALRNIALFEDMGFEALKISIKSSDVLTTISACRIVSQKTDYPLHLGVTEAGSIIHAAIKSSLGIGILLSEGIGDTIRVSVTGDPVSEVGVAYGILRALEIRKVGPDIISCPTCGRCEIDLVRLTREVEKKLAGMKTYMKIALMGCVVNGPGEAVEADIGIAGGRGFGIIFKKGKMARKVREKDLVPALLEEVKHLAAEKQKSR
ncbi:MAG: flavodoxin-dependent (E)-4-hydroxy-3-methylbut-2-enyl-diphosphate synthase [Deltaproteobacteria bacterium]|nr:flavodoxin-dependent (E)-4-hydroxy-3-methylbut-2-enyl-diphosphate synthase [Deltaproteobacteria bacterium]